MAETPVPPVDYLSRDYAAIRADLLAGIQPRMDEWRSRSQNDFGIVLLELFAYMGDGLHFYIDRVANEAFLATATQRRSVLGFARLLDYRPAGTQAARVTLVFTNKTSAPVTVPAGTRCATASLDIADSIYYETQAELVVPANTSGSTLALEGITVALEQLGISDGSPDQDFRLAQAPVIEGTISVSVSEAGGAVWAFYEHLLDAEPNDPAYSLYTDERDIVHVVFGDNVNGKIPAPAAPIRATYRVGGGARGNVGRAQITRIVTGNLPSLLTVTNPDPAAGGVDAETLAQMKANIPQSLYARRRAVTAEDYEALGEFASRGKVKVSSVTPRVVTMFVVPPGGGVVTDQLRAQMLAYLEPRKMVATTLVIESVDYVPTNIRVTVTVRDQYQTSRVQGEVLKALKTRLTLDKVRIGERIRLGDIYALVGPMPGVLSVTVDELSRDGDEPEEGSLDAVFRDFECPVEGVVEVAAQGGISG